MTIVTFGGGWATDLMKQTNEQMNNFLMSYVCHRQIDGEIFQN